MNIITGYRGEPHITAQEDRDLNLGVVGNSLNDVYVLDVGQKLEADIVTANEIRIRDGIMIMQGCAASIDYGTYDTIEISNGALGMQRIDIIAAQYEKDADTSVENVSLVVVEGTPDAADPQPPTLTGGDLQGGDTFIQMPLYYVNLDGVSIDSIEAKFKITANLAESTISPDVLAKWDVITGETAFLNNVVNYLADKVALIGKPLTMSNTNWSSGNCTVTDSSKYWAFLAWSGGAPMFVCFDESRSNVYGYSIASVTTNSQYTRTFSASVSGDVWTMTNHLNMGHNGGGNHANGTATTINWVIGLIPKQ